MEPLISVVIPTFNQADFLKEALDSVLNQTYQNYEVIVVNNYSTDHTLDVIRDANDHRVAVTDFQNNGVIGAGRNVGIRAANGDYVAFLDSDDIWYSDKLEKIAAAISADPDLGLLCHDQDIVRNGEQAGIARYGPHAGFNGGVHDFLLYRGNCVSTSAAVVARRFLSEVGNFSEDPEFATVEDYDLWLKLSKVCRFHFIHEALGVHNYHPGGASARTELHLQATMAVLESHSNVGNTSQQADIKKGLRRRYGQAFYGAARQYHRNGELKRAFGYYSRSIRTFPWFSRLYLAMTLLTIDILLGQSRRKKVVRALSPGSWLAGWIVS